MRTWKVFSSLAIVCLFCSQSEAISQAASDSYLIESRNNELAVLQYVVPVLRSAGKGGRIYFRAKCPFGVSGPVLFPRFRVKPPPGNARGADAVGSIFQSNKHLVVSEDRTTIRIKLADTANEILRTKIAKLRLDQLSRYNPALAIGAIERTEEVKNAMRKHRLFTPVLPIEMLMTEPNPKEPHLPVEMQDISVERALDKVAATFSGVLFYAECPNEHVFEISFDGGVGFSERLFYKRKER